VFIRELLMLWHARRVHPRVFPLVAVEVLKTTAVHPAIINFVFWGSRAGFNGFAQDVVYRLAAVGRETGDGLEESAISLLLKVLKNGSTSSIT